MEILDNDIQGMTVESRLRNLIERVLEGSDFFIVDLVIRGHAGSQVVEVYLDRETGANIDELAKVSRRLAEALEVEDLLADGYRLDVSTPGLDRPLTDRRQFARHREKSLQVRFRENDQARNVKGVLADISAEGITLELGNSERVEIPFDTIEKATVQLPW